MTDFAGSLDANVLLRLLLNDVPKQHVKALKLFNEEAGQFAIADIAVVEAVFVLCRAYGFTREQASEAIEGLTRLPGINLNRALFKRALPIFMGHPALSFEDCCLSVYAELNEVEPLWTFDKKLAIQAINAKIVE
jgi:predicted nucleic-acid-binding protein